MRFLFKLLVALAAMACGYGPAFSQERLTYKGVALGASMSEFASKLPDFKCSGSVCTYMLTACRDDVMGCRDRTSFGGAHVQYAAAHFVEDKLERVTFTMPSPIAAELLKAAKARYGEPTTVDSEPFRSRGGAVAPNEKAVWQRGGDVLTVILRAGTIDGGFALLQTAADVQRSVDEGKAATKKASSDF